jgi:hypothetical protein
MVDGKKMTDNLSSSANSPIAVVADECAAYLVSTSGNTTTGMLRQKGTSGEGGALSVVSENPDTSTVLFNGVEKSRGTVKITHSGYADGSDSYAAAISIDLRVAGTAAHGIFVTSTGSPTRGNLIVLRNNDVDDLVVKGSGRVGIGVEKGKVPAGTIEVVQRDTRVPAIIVVGRTDKGSVIEVRGTNGRRIFEIDADGEVTTSCLKLTSAASSAPGTGCCLSISTDGLNSRVRKGRSPK